MAGMAEDQKVTPFIEIGSTGLERYGGIVSEEWLRDLQGAKGIKAYKEMRDNDPITGAILFALKMLFRQANWYIEAGGSTTRDEEAKAFLESCLDDMSMSWHDTITEILSMLVFGWSWHETVYKLRQGDGRDPRRRSKYSDGRIGWRKLPIRAQETFYEWVFDDTDGGVIALKQMPPPDYQVREIPIGKSLLFRTESSKANPEGRSVLRNAYRPFYYRKNIEQIEAIGIERDLAGLPVAEVPPSILSPFATEDEKKALSDIKKMVTEIRRDKSEGVVFPSEFNPDGTKTGYKLSLLSTGGRRNFDTNAIVNRYDQRIAMTVLADFILLGHEKVGSFALNSSKTVLFSTALGAFLDSVCEIFNTHGVPRLFALNAFQGLTDLPKLKHGDVESPDLTELGAYITSLSGAGAPLFPDDDLENYLRSAASLPEKPKVDAGQVPNVAATTGEEEQAQKRYSESDKDEFIDAVRELRAVLGEELKKKEVFSAEIDMSKHLPGRHNQQDHAPYGSRKGPQWESWRSKNPEKWERASGGKKGEEKGTASGGSSMATERRGHEAPDKYFSESKGSPDAEAKTMQQKLKEETGVEHDIESIKKMRESVNSYSGDDYVAIRDAQAGANQYPPKHIKAAAQDLDRFIEVSPKFKSPPPLARGIKVDRGSDFLSGLKSGATIDMRGTSSWSSNKDIAHGFAKSGEVPVVFQLSKTSLGTSIKHLSSFPGEDEVLMHSSAKFKISAVKKTKFGSKLTGQKDGFVVELEELPLSVAKKLKNEDVNYPKNDQQKREQLAMDEKWALGAIAITDEEGNSFISEAE